MSVLKTVLQRQIKKPIDKTSLNTWLLNVFCLAKITIVYISIHSLTYSKSKRSITVSSVLTLEPLLFQYSLYRFTAEPIVPSHKSAAAPFAPFSHATVYNLRPYGCMRPSIKACAAVHMQLIRYGDRAKTLLTVWGYLVERRPKTDVWKQGRHSVWKKNRSNSKKLKTS